MISVGLRLTEEVFPGPEEPIADLPMTNDSPKMVLDGIDKNGVAKIKRIVLNRTATVEFLRAESPSRIWVRLQNHITESTLTFREPFALQPKQRVIVGDYALAPTEHRVYRRCRILEHENNDGLIKIFFIDDATVAWVKKECLGVMKEELMFYPWQAIQISMFGVYPAVDDFDGKDSQKWSTDTCNKLSQILQYFALLRVEVVLSTVVFNDYARPIPVKLFGIKEGIDEKDQNYRAMSIGQILESNVIPVITTKEEPKEIEEESDEEDVVREPEQEETPKQIISEPSEVVCMDLYDAALHEIFDVAEKEEIPREALDIHMEFPLDWKQEADKDEDEKLEKEEDLFSKDSMSVAVEPNDWNPRLNRIEMLSIEELGNRFEFPDEQRGVKRRIMLALEGRCTKSPYEWYARPIVKTGKNSRDENVPWTTDNKLTEVDPTDWMLYGNDQLLAVAEQLDTYYSNQKNRKPLKADEIQTLMKEHRDVFAVCAVNEEKGNYTGEWQRVLIVNCDTFAEVRFLDSGGRDMVLTSSLYRIHSQHCRFPPMCLRFAIHGAATKTGRVDGKWHTKETSRFRMCLREDTPIFIDIDDIASLPLPTSAKQMRSHVAKHVLMARNVSYMDESRTLMDRFLSDEEGGAMANQNEPAEWYRH